MDELYRVFKVTATDLLVRLFIGVNNLKQAWMGGDY